MQLAREELTGVLAPLADVDFFERVFIDQGAVTWPGEIDLAPEAMHADITARNSQRLGMRFSPESPDVAGYRTGGSPPDPPAGTDAF